MNDDDVFVFVIGCFLVDVYDVVVYWVFFGFVVVLCDWLVVVGVDVVDFGGID